MMKSSTSLMAEDVTIRCRIRRISCPAATTNNNNTNQPIHQQKQQHHHQNGGSVVDLRKFCCSSLDDSGGMMNHDNDDVHDMLCTLRNWETPQSKAKTLFYHNNYSSSSTNPLEQQPQQQLHVGKRLFGTSRPTLLMFNKSKVASTTDHQNETKTTTTTSEKEQVCYNGPELVLISIEQHNHRDDSPLRRSRCIKKKTNSQQHNSSLTATTMQDNNNSIGSQLHQHQPQQSTSSFSSSFLTTEQQQQIQPFVQFRIQLMDIIGTVIVMNNHTTKAKQLPQHNNNKHRIIVSTNTTGIYEFQNLTENAFDILVTFLQAFVPLDRIVYNDENSKDRTKNNERNGVTSLNKTSFVLENSNTANNEKYKYNQTNHGGSRNGGRSDTKNPTSTIRSTSSADTSVTSSCIIDIDAFHAKHVDESAANETWSEKLSRRVNHIVISLSELCVDVASSTQDGCYCCSTNTNTTSKTKSHAPNNSQHHLSAIVAGSAFHTNPATVAGKATATTPKTGLIMEPTDYLEIDGDTATEVTNGTLSTTETKTPRTTPMPIHYQRNDHDNNTPLTGGTTTGTRTTTTTTSSDKDEVFNNKTIRTSSFRDTSSPSKRSYNSGGGSVDDDHRTLKMLPSGLSVEEPPPDEEDDPESKYHDQ